MKNRLGIIILMSRNLYKKFGDIYSSCRRGGDAVNKFITDQYQKNFLDKYFVLLDVFIHQFRFFR